MTTPSTRDGALRRRPRPGPRSGDLLTIGRLSARSGLAHSALRYYESLGLIQATRTSGGQRRYSRGVLRRIAFVHAAQRVGLSLDEAREALDRLPERPAPSGSEWDRVATARQDRIDEQIAELERLKARLTGCIGCGCLSLTRCALHNADDRLGQAGPGAHYLRTHDPADELEGGR